MEFVFGTDERRETRNLQELTPSTPEVREASFDSAFDDNPVSRILTYQESRDSQRGPKLSREEIQNRAIEQGAELKEIPEDGLSAYGAQVLIDRQVRKKRNDEVLSDDRLSFGQNMLSMGAGFAAGALDPINGAVNLVPFVGVTRGAALLAKAGGSIAGRAGVRVGIGAIEGAGGAALTEAAVNYPLAQELGEDYGAQNVLQNIFYGAAFGAGLKGVAGFVSDVVDPSSFKKAKGSAPPDGPLPASPELRSAPDVPQQVRALGIETHEKAASTAVAHLLEGKNVEVNPIIDGQTAKFANDIENTKLQEPSTIFDEAQIEAQRVYERGVIEGRLAKEPEFTPEDRVGFDRAEYKTSEEAAVALQQKIMDRLKQGERLYLTANKQNYLILGEESGRLKVIEPNDVNGFFIPYKDLADRTDFAINSKEIDYYGGDRAKRIASETAQERSGKSDDPSAPKTIMDENLEAIRTKVEEPENAMFMDRASDESLTATKNELEAEPGKTELEKARVDSDSAELEAEIKDLQKQMGDEIVLEEVKEIKQANEAIKEARDFGSKLKLLAGCALRRGKP